MSIGQERGEGDRLFEVDDRRIGYLAVGLARNEGHRRGCRGERVQKVSGEVIDAGL
jgi:hypothetical protein